MDLGDLVRRVHIKEIGSKMVVKAPVLGILSIVCLRGRCLQRMAKVTEDVNLDHGGARKWRPLGMGGELLWGCLFIGGGNPLKKTDEMSPPSRPPKKTARSDHSVEEGKSDLVSTPMFHTTVTTLYGNLTHHILRNLTNEQRLRMGSWCLAST